jgi:predicted metal-dependent phosphoesterase TrpH
MTDNACYKGIIHFHSSCSYDSVTRPDTIIAAARKYEWDFVILTDHGTIRGSQALRKRIEECGSDLIAPMAAEYRTEYGDVIAAFIQTDIVESGLDSFVAEVRKQNGLILLPHPYVGHEEIDLLAQHADLIEVFNARIPAKENARAAELVERTGKPCYHSADAHLASTMANVVVSVERTGDLKGSLLHGRIRMIRSLPSVRRDVVISQLIKAAKTRDGRLFFGMAYRFMLQGLRGQLGRGNGNDGNGG